MAKKRKREGGPMSAAGLIAFYDEYEGKIKMSPTTLVLASTIFAAIVVIAHMIF
ncbi:MAG: preprotein translocase subunit Sec61beta [Desulfurococcales archaeon]|nr:preprotein translocase subunit Sec61beta [Desulfurococcales archaeon]